MSILMTALLTGCGMKLGGESTDLDVQTSFSRVVNNTGATIVLVGPDQWSAEDYWKQDADCASVLSDLSIGVNDDVLTLSSNDPAVHQDCRVNVRQEHVREIDCDGDGDLGHDGNMKDLTTITVKGNGAVEIDTLETDHLDLAVYGNGAVRIDDLQADLLTLDMTGASDVFLAGAVEEGEFSISGVGNLEASELVIQDLWIELSGEGNATVTVEGTIEGALSGDGNIDVYGNPESTVEESGTGIISMLKD
jgi:hypothetical protein